ncbi:XylR family transcriptional regulator [Calycomorphotria hydatis]|uniref:Xylose operon regulatory protein n=1 Tax=Calycomorphotria hydatis TaxID=2528027 RepID=A0A517T9X3_9PLAN|nr:DNA-binding transcriptional regulator [Calycomorphotria hydatis]QDT65163.1 Xylose operon regulatory protein [Calycomorphotria hydatis]
MQRKRQANALSSVADETNVLLTLSWYYPEIHRGVTRFARDHHWHVTADFEDPVPTHWKGDGVLTLLGARENLWRQVRKLNVPIVDLAESRPNIQLPRVTINNEQVGLMAGEHFLERGFRNYAYVQRWDLGVSRRRREAWMSALQEAGFQSASLNWQAERRQRADTRERRHHWLIERLSQLPKPLAVFASRDTDAVEVIEACLSSGLSVPDEVAVLGVDNTETICDCLRIPLSSISCNWEKVGYEGAALLHRLIKGGRVSLETTYIPPTGIVTRRSTDSMAVEHPEVVKALRFIKSHYQENISMNDVLRQVPMSRSGLEKAFREHYIRPPMEEVRQLRMNHAKKLLRETEHKILTVAHLSGFQDSHSLCRAFRQYLGTTPKRYRHASK